MLADLLGYHANSIGQLQARQAAFGYTRSPPRQHRSHQTFFDLAARVEFHASNTIALNQVE